ncbi:hypothetical protein LTS17_006308 [Exophiala oligosperma]
MSVKLGLKMSFHFNLNNPDDPFGVFDGELPDINMDEDDDAAPLAASTPAPDEDAGEDENEDCEDDEDYEEDEDDENGEDGNAKSQHQVLEDLESELNVLTLDAETVISCQPRATQIRLVVNTRKIFNDYKQYGSMARLRRGIEKFFERDDIRDGKKLEYATLEEEQANTDPGHFGEVFMVNDTADDDVPKFVDGDTRTYNTAHGPRSKVNKFHSVDRDYAALVATEPWDPVAINLKWPGVMRWPPGILGKLDQIFSLVDYESRVRLFHHVSRYGPSPIFRLGITEDVRSMYSTILETSQAHYLGLTPETRSFLRSAFVSMRSQPNAAETRLLSQACQIGEDSVNIFWEDFNASRRGHTAMRIFMTAREIEKSKEARIAAPPAPQHPVWKHFQNREGRRQQHQQQQQQNPNMQTTQR